MTAAPESPPSRKAPAGRRTVLRATWIVGLLAVVALGIAQQRQLDHLRRESQRLAALQEEAARLRERATAAQAVTPADQARRQAETRELARLRNQVRELREQVRQTATAGAAPPRDGASEAGNNPRRKPALATFTFDTVSNAGRQTPEATLQTLLWSLREGNLETMMGCLSARARESFHRGEPDRSAERFAEESNRMKEVLRGIDLLARKENEDGSLKLGLRVRVEHEGNSLEQEMVMRFARDGGEWHLDDSP